jgi:hypothetical protein
MSVTFRNHVRRSIKYNNFKYCISILFDDYDLNALATGWREMKGNIAGNTLIMTR